MEYERPFNDEATLSSRGSTKEELKRRGANFEGREVSKASSGLQYNVPSYSHLKSLVQKVVITKSWWELYGIDLTVITVTSVLLLPAGFLLMKSSNIALFSFGFLILAYLYYFYGSKSAHMASHGSLGKSRFWNRCLGKFFSEVCGGFTYEEAENIHIKIHHPYTNIIGLGDSSTWRAPFLDRVSYFFVAPLFLPLLAPLLSIKLLWGRWKSLMYFIPTLAVGMSAHFFLLRKISGFSVVGAWVCMFTTRGLFSTLYVHINIFQHIGLSFYALERRPDRLLQMANGVLNLQKNLFLDSCFGHSITTCHVEHHLFPHLSDNMCLSIKPLVSEYFKVHNLTYNEDSYSNRLKLFYSKYTELMVHAPPITDFVGVQ